MRRRVCQILLRLLRTRTRSRTVSVKRQQAANTELTWVETHVCVESPFISNLHRYSYCLIPSQPKARLFSSITNALPTIERSSLLLSIGSMDLLTGVYCSGPIKGYKETALLLTLSNPNKHTTLGRSSNTASQSLAYYCLTPFLCGENVGMRAIEPFLRMY